MSEFLEVKGARTHNLKNIDVKIPKNTLTVITGLSGSGKSSLAFSTIYSIGQQKYLESLSSYARMFVDNKSDEAIYDEIKGLSPTISIDQKTTNRNPRSTVGTITEIYDYYKILYLNLWKRTCIVCWKSIHKDSMRDIIAYIAANEPWKKFFLTFPLEMKKSQLFYEDIKKAILDLGFIRFLVNEKEYTLDSDFSSELWNLENMRFDIIVDRLVIAEKYETALDQLKRLKDSLELCMRLGNGQVGVHIIDSEKKIIRKNFSQWFVCSYCGHIPAKLSVSSFSFNSHGWACLECHGLWEKMVFLEENIINPRLSLSEWAVLPSWFWNYFLAQLESLSHDYNIRIHIPFGKLTSEEKNIVMYGAWEKKYTVSFINEQWRKNTYISRYEWVIPTLTRRYYDGGIEHGNYEEYVSNIECPTCHGFRLSQESLSVSIAGKNIWELSNFTVKESKYFFSQLTFWEEEQKVAQKILKNIIERLDFLMWVSLSYISISRKSSTLSGWEAQRIRLATQIWVKLEGIIYVLDEPSIWLHPRDNDMLIANLKKLRDLWNTLLVVEHDEDIMRESDYIIDIGPGAWVHGGRIVAEWTFEDICNNSHSVTWPYLSGQKEVKIDKKKRDALRFLEVIGAKEHNLKNIDVAFPVWQLTVVTGVSWSWKSSLVNDILANFLANTLNKASKTVWKYKDIRWYEVFDKVLVIDQSPIWKTPRSNPATYTWVFTAIREVFASSYDAKIRWYGPGRFSFNTKLGRCDACDGDGVIKVEMHFLPPVYTTCEICWGKKFNSETLEIKYKGKDISDILDMTIDEAYDFFHSHPRIVKVLWVLKKVWLWYLKLGQSSTTLSGWEAQRIKLATELSKRSSSQTIYILDEPTTGLHFQDVQKLLMILHSLVEKWNTVIVIEHNINVILNADFIVDIGPEWWDAWWKLLVCWDIDTVRKSKKSYTGQAIQKYLDHFKK